MVVVCHDLVAAADAPEIGLRTVEGVDGDCTALGLGKANAAPVRAARLADRRCSSPLAKRARKLSTLLMGDDHLESRAIGITVVQSCTLEAW